MECHVILYTFLFLWILLQNLEINVLSRSGQCCGKKLRNDFLIKFSYT